MIKDDHDYPYAFLTYYIDIKGQCIIRVGHQKVGEVGNEVVHLTLVVDHRGSSKD
jgi:hypothetical protein